MSVCVSCDNAAFFPPATAYKFRIIEYAYRIVLSVLCSVTVSYYFEIVLFISNVKIEQSGMLHDVAKRFKNDICLAILLK